MNKDNLDEIDKLLYEEMPFLADKIMERLPNENELNHVFSSEFESKMDDLIRQNKKRKSLIKYAKAISITFILLIFGSLINPDTYASLKDVINSITKVFSTHTIIEFSNEKNNNTTKTFEPSYIPKGYKEIDEVINNSYREIIYENNKDLSLTYTCQIIHATTFFFDLENADVENLTVDNEEATLINKNKLLTLYYKKDNYFFIITADYKKDSDVKQFKNELIKIAESKKIL